MRSFLNDYLRLVVVLLLIVGSLIFFMLLCSFLATKFGIAVGIIPIMIFIVMPIMTLMLRMG